MNPVSLKNMLCVAFIAVSLSACTKQLKQDQAVTPEKLAATGIVANAPSPDGALLRQLFNSKGPVFESYIINAQEGGQIRSKKGSTYVFPRNAFINKDGSPTVGTVNISIKEIKDVSDMILADKQTVTRNGGILESFGEFFVSATQGGQNVRLKKDSAIVVRIPAKAREQVPMWTGDTTVTITQSGFNYLNQPVTITQQISANKGVDWAQNPNPPSAYALFNNTTGTLDFRLDSLIRWYNCDRLITSGPKTTVLGYFTNNYNPATATSYTGEEPSMLFFKPKTITSIVKFYNLIFTPPAGYEGFLSYQTSVPINQAGTFLAISSINGQFYAEQKDVTIAAPTGTNNYSTVSFNLQPVTASALIALITSMNTK